MSGRRAAPTLGWGAVVFGLLSNWPVRRKLFDLVTFGYDGLQYLGPDAQPITPNERFYTVTKNVIDPRVNKSLWRLEVTGLVTESRLYRCEDITALEPAVTQETTKIDAVLQAQLARFQLTTPVASSGRGCGTREHR